MIFNFRPVSNQPPYIRLRGFDLMIMAMAPPVAFLLRDNTYLRVNDVTNLLLYTGIAVASTWPFLQYFGVNRIASSYFSSADALKILKAVIAGVLLTTVIGFTVTRLEGVPRSLPIIHFLVLTAGLMAGRIVTAQRSQQRNRPPAVAQHSALENVLIVGANRNAFLYAALVEALAPGSKRIVGLLADDKKLQHHSIGGHEVLGRFHDLARIAAEYSDHGLSISEAVVTTPRSALATETLSHLTDVAAAHGIRITMLEDIVGVRAEAAAAEARITEDNAKEAAVASTANPYWRWKRIFDIAVAGLGVIVLAPILACVASAVWLDNGRPLIFWQERIGRNGRRFFVFKFRTMRPKFDHVGRAVGDGERISALGRFLRRTHLDELPQLFNVLAGDMSLVGPRPLLPADQPADAALRLAVRPGLTGWAQINGGTLLDARSKGALDSWYVGNASVILDLQIIAVTLTQIVRRGGAAGNSAAETRMDTLPSHRGE